MVESFAAWNLYKGDAAMPSPGRHGEAASVAPSVAPCAVCPSLLSLEKSSKWIDASDRYVDGVAEPLQGRTRWSLLDASDGRDPRGPGDTAGR